MHRVCTFHLAQVAAGLLLVAVAPSPDALAQRMVYIDGHRIDGAALTLIGENGIQKTLTAEELAALPQQEVRIRERDSSTITFRGPTLRSLATLAEATDGYRIAFMLAELDEQFGAREAILALTQDGQALPERDGPYRIVVPAEMHRARWARQVNVLRLLRVGS
jgi:DMSO/TMAO reductase YedYZ molybdopterin-dependent catalytic subunit